MSLVSKRPTRDPARGIVVLRLEVMNQAAKTVQIGEMTLMMMRRAPA